PWATFAHADGTLVLGPQGTLVHVMACPAADPCYSGEIKLSRSGTSTQRISWVSEPKRGAHIDGDITLAGDYLDVRDFDVETSGWSAIQNADGGGNYAHIVGNSIHDVAWQADRATSACSESAAISLSRGCHDGIVDANVIVRAGTNGGCSDGAEGANG